MNSSKQLAKGLKSFTEFITTHRRWRVALAGYAIVVVFVLSYLAANQAQSWFRISALSQLIFAVLITAPLALAFFGDRITKVKAFEVEVSFAEVTVIPQVSFNEALSNLQTLAYTRKSDIGNAIKETIRKEETAKLIEVNLDLNSGNRENKEVGWWVTQLHLLAALAEDYTKIQQFVFLENCECGEKCFIGITTPAATRRALATQHPALEIAYRKARLSIPFETTTSLEKEVESVMNGLHWSSSEPEYVETYREYIEKHRSEVQSKIETLQLKQWLGQDLITQHVVCEDFELEDSQLKPMLLYRIMNRTAPFVALVKNRKLMLMVDRQETAIRIAHKVL